MTRNVDASTVGPAVERGPREKRRLTPEQERLDVILRETYGSGLPTRVRAPSTTLRRCRRCGIDTTRPDLCRDCQDVT
jgi:hypothetical protein